MNVAERPLKVSVMFYIMLSLQMACLAGQSNMIANADFETGSPANWSTCVAQGTIITQSWATDKFVSATHSLKSVMANNGTADWRQFFSSIDATVTYRLRAHIYASNITSGSHSVEIQWFNGSQYLSRNIIASPTANSWMEAEAFNIIPPSNATSAYLLLRTYMTGTYYFDDVVLLREDKNLYTISTSGGQKFPIGLHGLASTIKRSYDFNNPTVPIETWDNFELVQNSDFSWPDIAGDLPGAWNRLCSTPAIVTYGYVLNSNAHYICTQLSSDGNAQWRQWIYNLKTDWTYKFSAKFYVTNALSGSHCILLQWFNDQGTCLGQNSYSVTTANNWVTVGPSSITPPSGSTRVCVMLESSKTGTYYFDDVSLKVDKTYAQCLQEAKNAGFSFVNNDNIGMTPYDGLDLKYGFYLWDDMYLDSSDPNYTQKRNNLIADVNSCDSDDAIALWYGPDEAAWNGLSAQGVINGYNTVTANDSYYTSGNHKVWLNHAPRGTAAEPTNFAALAGYNSGLDIVSMDIYPVPQGNGHSSLSNQSVSCVGDYADILYNQVVRANNVQTKPIWMVLQGCGWTDMSAYPCWKYQSIEIHWYSSGGTFLGRNIFDNYMPDEWCPASLEYLKPPANTAYCYVVGRAYGQGDFYFDDISLWNNDSSIEYLNNTGFESAPNSSTDWTFSGTTATGVWDSTVAHSGTHSVRITEASTGGGGQWCHKAVTIDPTKLYNLYGTMRADIRPNLTQMRFMTYNAIIHGARGITYYGNFYLPMNSVTWTNTKSMATELNNISDVLISNLSFRTVTVNNSNIETVLFKRGTGLCLIAANKGTSTASVNVQISGLPLSSVARTAGESGSVTISSNSFSDSFSAYQVHVYNLN